jgi:hypothetical protein
MHSFSRTQEIVLWLLITPSGLATLGLIVSSILVLLFVLIRRQLRITHRRKLAAASEELMISKPLQLDSEHWSRAVGAALELLAITRMTRHFTDRTNIAAWAAVNATVVLRAGTVNGLTQWIAQTAREYDLILVDTEMTASMLLRTQSPKACVLPITAISGTGDVARFRNIYVDGASLMRQEDIQAMYSAPAHSVEQRWFLLG